MHLATECPCRARREVANFWVLMSWRGTRAPRDTPHNTNGINTYVHSTVYVCQKLPYFARTTSARAVAVARHQSARPDPSAPAARLPSAQGTGSRRARQGAAGERPRSRP
jgi:hypothetical protein